MKSFKYFLLFFVLFSTFNFGYGLECYYCNENFESKTCEPEKRPCGGDTGIYYRYLVYFSDPSVDYSCASLTYRTNDTKSNELYIHRGCTNAAKKVEHPNMVAKEVCKENLCNDGAKETLMYQNVSKRELKCFSCNEDKKFSNEIERKCLAPVEKYCGSDSNDYDFEPSSLYACVKGVYPTDRGEVAFMGCENSENVLRGLKGKKTCKLSLCNGGIPVVGELMNGKTKIAPFFHVIVITCFSICHNVLKLC